MLTVDGRCPCGRCEERTGDIYRMVGSCSNCGLGDILMLFRAGDRTANLDCPACGVFRSVVSARRAEVDEVPVG